MAQPPPDQRIPFAVRICFALFALVPLTCLTAATAEPDPANPAIRASALPVVVLWCVGVCGYELAWRAGAVACAAHVCVAFHLGHGWSHERAWEHTREAGGFGDGIFVNYVLVVVWLADAIRPARSGWRWWAVRGFVAFVMVNAAVVFGSWPARAAFVLLLGAGFALNRSTDSLPPPSECPPPSGSA
jgi:hypothetical protein